ncbi:MAG: hypothetical protein IKN59_05965 [Paludibacteraceae bacterium]|nr:hypothetical protein [Paludibacteraceae bacterium]
MNNYSSINNLQKLEQEKRILRKRIRKQENNVLTDLGAMRASAEKWVNGVIRFKNIAQFFLPKFEIATILFPIVRKIFRWRRKK